MADLADYLELTVSQAREQFRALLTRRPIPGGRQVVFSPVETLLCLAASFLVTLGDAGAAIDTARTVNLDQVTVTECKASMLIDTARAFLRYGKHENAYLALRAARDIAPEEIARRPAVRQLVRNLITSAPPSVRRQAEDFARGSGVSR